MTIKKRKLFLYIILFIIIFAGFILRTYKITDIPAGFFCDEASTGYNAYLLSTTGKDEYGKQYPIFFQSFGNYRPGIPVYLDIPFIKIFGLNEFSVRLTTTIVGTLNIIFIFLLARLLFSSTSIGILSAFLLSISPWHIHFSRFGDGVITFPLFLTISFFLFLSSIKRTNKILLWMSFFSFSLTLYTYYQAYYFVPVFIFFLLIIYKKELFSIKKNLIIALIILIITAIPFFKETINGNALVRLHQVSMSNNNLPFEKIKNKMLFTYLDHFKPEFLFEKGDIGYHTHFITRYSVRGLGELYWFQLPLIIFGLIYLFRYKKSFLLLLFWLLLYPLGSTLAGFADGGGPFATRSIIGVIPFQIISALGLVYLVNFFKKKIYKIIVSVEILIIICFSFIVYLDKYFNQYVLYSSDFWGWQFGPKAIIEYFDKNQNNYDQLIMAPEFNAPEIFFKFYSPNDCKKCFVGFPNEFRNQHLKQLFAVKPDYLANNYQYLYKIKKTIYYPNGNIAFLMIEIIK